MPLVMTNRCDLPHALRGFQERFTVYRALADRLQSFVAFMRNNDDLVLVAQGRVAGRLPRPPSRAASLGGNAALRPDDVPTQLKTKIDQDRPYVVTNWLVAAIAGPIVAMWDVDSDPPTVAQHAPALGQTGSHVCQVISVVIPMAVLPGVQIRRAGDDQLHAATWQGHPAGV